VVRYVSWVTAAHAGKLSVIPAKAGISWYGLRNYTEIAEYRQYEIPALRWRFSRNDKVKMLWRPGLFRFRLCRRERSGGQAS
jgi:hypothetical protein